MKTIIAENGQTIFDIAMQEMGSIEGVFDILENNAFLRLDMAIAAGTRVLVPDKVINSGVVDYYTRNNIKPASGLGEEININQNDMINITQNVAYDLSAGNKSFDGVRLANLGNILTVQIDYTGIAAQDIHVYVEQSLDGVDYSAVTGANQVLDSAKPSHTFNITGLLTNFCRVRVEVVSAGDGTIDEIIWRT